MILVCLLLDSILLLVFTVFASIFKIFADFFLTPLENPILQPESRIFSAVWKSKVIQSIWHIFWEYNISSCLMSLMCRRSLITAAIFTRAVSCQGKVIGQRQELDTDTAFFTFLLAQARIQSETFLLQMNMAEKLIFFCFVTYTVETWSKAKNDNVWEFLFPVYLFKTKLKFIAINIWEFKSLNQILIFELLKANTYNVKIVQNCRNVIIRIHKT